MFTEETKVQYAILTVIWLEFIWEFYLSIRQVFLVYSDMRLYLVTCLNMIRLFNLLMFKCILLSFTASAMQENDYSAIRTSWCYDSRNLRPSKIVHVG